MSIVRCPVCRARREAVQVWALGRDLWQVKHVGPALFALDGPCPAQLAESSVLAVSREALEQEFGREERVHVRRAKTPAEEAALERIREEHRARLAAAEQQKKEAEKDGEE